MLVIINKNNKSKIMKFQFDTTSFVRETFSAYPAFEEQMNIHGYDWEAHEVVTDDDYILTLFHIIGDDESQSSRGSVLI